MFDKVISFLFADLAIVILVVRLERRRQDVGRLSKNTTLAYNHHSDPRLEHVTCFWIVTVETFTESQGKIEAISFRFPCKRG